MGRLVESNAGQRGGKEWETETLAYDGNGRLLLAENKDCKLQWFYDLAGNNTREHQHFKYMQQPKVAVFTHEYDALNLRVATTRPDGHRVSWLTYGSGHLLGLKFDDRELLSYQRDDLHREIGREQGNGLIQRQTWTANGQLLEQTLAHHGATRRIAARNYRYDESGQLTHVNDLEKLSGRDLNMRSEAFTKAERYIDDACKCGGVSAQASKSFKVRDTKGERVDIEVITGSAFEE